MTSEVTPVDTNPLITGNLFPTLPIRKISKNNLVEP
jgi:CheY-like chemotaxis protein